MKPLHIMAITAVMALLLSCGNKQSTAQVVQLPDPVAVEFDADNAYNYIRQQTSFGPRVPGSAASAECAKWLVATLDSLGASDIQQQRATVTAYNGTTLPINNISARFNPEAKKRILLLSHWDSRPWADHDPDSTNHRSPIDGANDGASGVGVILEIARCISLEAPNVGVDVLFVDAEDYGKHAKDISPDNSDNSWALGSQHWATNPTIPLDQIKYAILLDMVGGKNAVFPREYFSDRAAKNICDKIIKAATIAGYSSRFPNSMGSPVTDDHIPLLEAGMQAIDIVESANPVTGCFSPTWHTKADNIDNIDKSTLKAVGQTLIQLIYTE